MKSTIKKLPDSKVRLEVSLDKEELVEFAKEAEKDLANNLRIEGFRPGKAPKEIIRKHVGEEKIKEEALSIAVRSSFSDAVKNEKLDVIEQEEFKITENSPERMTYIMTLSIFPEIALGKYTGLDVKKNSVDVNEIEVDRTLGDLIKMRTLTKPVERPVQTGDKVEVDFSIFLDGKLIEGGKSENHPLVIGENKFIPGFEEQVVGMNAGDAKSFSINVPGDYHQKNISGKEIKIDLKLNKVEQLMPPQVNDEFAKSLGRFSSLAELKENLRQSLLTEKETKEKDRVRLVILNQIIVKSEIEVPNALVEERLDSMIRGFDQELHQKGMELGLYLAHLKKTQDDLRKDWLPQAQSQVKMNLVARAVARQEKINIADGEIEQEFMELAEHYTRQGMLDELQKLDPSAIKSQIKSVLLNEKVFEFLEKNNIL